MRRRDNLRLKRSESNLCLAYASGHGQPAVLQSLERTIAALEIEQAAIEQAIDDLVKRDPDLRVKPRFSTVPGICTKNVLSYRWQARTTGKGTPKGLC